MSYMGGLLVKGWGAWPGPGWPSGAWTSSALGTRGLPRAQGELQLT